MLIEIKRQPEQIIRKSMVITLVESDIEALHSFLSRSMLRAGREEIPSVVHALEHDMAQLLKEQ